MVGSRSLRIISLLNRNMGLVSWRATARVQDTREQTSHLRSAWTHRAGAVAAHAPLHHHALASIDHEDLMLDCNLVFGLDGMFELQHAETRGKV